MGVGGVSDGEDWQPGVVYTSALKLFGLALSPRSASHRPKHAKRAKGMSHYHWGQFQTHSFYVMPSIGPVVSAVTLIGKTHSIKADKSATPGIGSVYG